MGDSPANSGELISTEPNYQEVDSDDLQEEQEELNDQELEALIQESENAFTDDELEHMEWFLKERGMIAWMKEYVGERSIPIRKLLLGFGVVPARNLRDGEDNALLPILKATLSRILRRREKLTEYNTVEDVIKLIRDAKNIIVLTGAGISVSCGVPDFRSENGLYAQLREKQEYGLDDPQQMFDIDFFKENPRVFYSFASQIYPTNFTPSPSHRFLKLLEDKKKLLRNYTQNIDTIETLVGVQRVLQCHGSFATASCMDCGRRVPGTDIKDAIMSQTIPFCSVCNVEQPSDASKRKKSPSKKKKGKKAWEDDDSGNDSKEEPLRGVMKPDITFFGEKLTDTFDKLLFEDRERVDLLIVMGTSLKVAPVSEILAHVPHSVPQVLINKTPVTHVNPDVVLLGESDRIVEYLCLQLGWDLPSSSLPEPRPNPRKRPSGNLFEDQPQRAGKSHIWLFEGADGGKWVEDVVKLSESLPTNPEELDQEEEDEDRDVKKARTE